MKKLGLIIIDLQNEYLPTGKLPLSGIETAADNAVETLGLERVGVHMRPVPSEGRTTNPRGAKSWEAAFGAQ